jgi:tetratricopeptide (TPR) repeat protein
VAGPLSLQAQLVLPCLAAAGLPAVILFRQARTRSSRLSERVLELCRLALATLLILAAFLFLLSLVSDGEIPTFLLAVGAGGAFILALCLRALGQGEVRPYIESAHRTYDRDRQPVRYWLSLGWNTSLGAVCLLLAFGATAANRSFVQEEACVGDTTGGSPLAREAACTSLLAEPDLPADLRAFAHDFRAEARRKLGRAYDAEVDTRAAISAYGEALAEDPGYAALYFNSGLAFHRIGAFPPAREAFDAAILLDPDKGDAFLNRGLVNLDDGRFADALTDFTRASERLPGEAWPLVNRGLAYAYLRNPAAAEADFAAARKLDPANTGILRGEALLALQKGEEERALDLLTRARQQDPSDHWSARQKNAILQARDRAAEAQRPLG